MSALASLPWVTFVDEMDVRAGAIARVPR